MDSKTLSATSLPCLSQNSVISPCSTRCSHHNSSKKFGMASEPLLLSTESDSEKLEEDFKFSEDALLKTTVIECQGPHALPLTESGTSSSSAAGYCFFCTQQGPIIKENISNDQKTKKRKKSQSLLVLNGSKRENTSHLLPDSCNNLTTMKSSSASILRSAILKVKQPSKNSSKYPSICSSLSKLTELQESCGLMCRICHSGNEDEELIRPCKCTGTVKYAHQSCILNWVSKSGHESCELCKFKFRTKKHSVKCFWKWSFPEVSTKGWLHIGLFIAFATMLLTSVTWIIWSRVSRTPSAIAERTTEEVKFAYMVNGLFIALAVGGLYFDSLKHFKQYSKRWAALNQNVVVECYEENGKVEGVDVNLPQRVCPRQSSVAMEESGPERLSVTVHRVPDEGVGRNDSTDWV